MQEMIASCECPLCVIHNPVLSVAIIAAAALWIALSLRSLRRRNARRLDFVRRTSHAIKTPLTSLRLYADLLSRDKLKSPEDVAEAHATIKTEAEKLSGFVDDLIEFGRLEQDGGSETPRG